MEQTISTMAADDSKTSDSTSQKLIVITGASSGIGKEFAIQMANHNKTLFLAGRNRTKLESVKSTCEKKGAEVITYVVDSINAQQISNCILQSDNQRPLDLIFANAGML